MNLKEMLELTQQKYVDAKTILANPNATPEEKARVPILMSEARQLKTDADSLLTIDREGGILAEMAKGVTEQKQQGAAPAQFKYWGEFLEATYHAQKGGKPDPRLRFFKDEVDPQNNTRAQKDMSGETGAGGGYLIEPEYYNTLMTNVSENSIVRPRASVIPMRRRSITIPGLDQTQSLPAGTPRWFGGMTAHWIGEGELKPESDPKFRDITLVAKKLVMFTRSSDELLDDAAISLEAFLSGPLGMAGAISWYEDYAFLFGTGVAQPLGIFNSPALLTIRRDVSGKVRYDDLVRMMAVAALTGTSEWVISQSVLPDLMNMQDGDGRLIWATATEGSARTLLGLPYRISEKLPPRGTTGDVLLADFQQYLIGDRQATTVESTKFEAWAYDKTSWRAVHRVDGQPRLNAPITYQDGVTQISPFVALSSDVS